MCRWICRAIMAVCFGSLLWSPGVSAASDGNDLKVTQTDEYVQIDTDMLQARILKKGYVSGVAQGSFLYRKTGARDLGYGLHIMDFLLAPGWKDDDYTRDAKVHGDLPKHLVEGPQICTQAKELKPEVIEGKDYVAVRLSYRFNKAGAGYKAGSTWEQTLVFQPGVRWFLSSEKINSVNDVDELFYRVDMPGHIKHKGDDDFAQVFLSYLDKPLLRAADFSESFAPDAKYLYQRKEDRIPRRMIRAYQVKQDGKAGPWLAGMTLDPAVVSEAWCHERGYVCFIEELHRKNVKAGESFGAAYLIGWFDDVEEMEKTFDRYKGHRSIGLREGKFVLE